MDLFFTKMLRSQHAEHFENMPDIVSIIRNQQKQPSRLQQVATFNTPLQNLLNNSNQQQQLNGISSSPTGVVPNGASANGNNNVNSNKNQLYKTELCRSFMEFGFCNYGQRCQYAHGEKEKRAVQRHPKYKTTACDSYHKTGYCPYGPRCHFIHGENDVNNSSSTLVTQKNGNEGTLLCGKERSNSASAIAKDSNKCNNIAAVGSGVPTVTIASPIYRRYMSAANLQSHQGISTVTSSSTPPISTAPTALLYNTASGALNHAKATAGMEHSAATPVGPVFAVGTPITPIGSAGFCCNSISPDKLAVAKQGSSPPAVGGLSMNGCGGSSHISPTNNQHSSTVGRIGLQKSTSLMSHMGNSNGLNGTFVSSAPMSRPNTLFLVNGIHNNNDSVPTLQKEMPLVEQVLKRVVDLNNHCTMSSATKNGEQQLSTIWQQDQEFSQIKGLENDCQTLHSNLATFEQIITSPPLMTLPVFQHFPSTNNNIHWTTAASAEHDDATAATVVDAATALCLSPFFTLDANALGTFINGGSNTTDNDKGSLSAFESSSNDEDLSALLPKQLVI